LKEVYSDCSLEVDYYKNALLAIESERNQMMEILNKLKVDMEQIKNDLNTRKQEATGLAIKVTSLQTDVNDLKLQNTNIIQEIEALKLKANNPTNSAAPAINSQMTTISNDISKLKSDLSILTQTPVTNSGTSTISVPTGLIAYFEKDCPTGWDVFLYSQGRFILSAGTLENRSQDGRLEKFIFEAGKMGGEVNHKLTISEMPKHNHSNNQYNQVLKSDCKNTITVTNHICYPEGEPDVLTSKPMTDQGNDEPHNNMPPYIVLKACQKK